MEMKPNFEKWQYYHIKSFREISLSKMRLTGDHPIQLGGRSSVVLTFVSNGSCDFRQRSAIWIHMRRADKWKSHMFGAHL